jgi:hypothetical protein
MKNIVFSALMLLCCGYAIFRGGRNGRIVVTLFVAAGVLSIPAANSAQQWFHINWATFAIDVCLLAALAPVALFARSFWPVWVVGFHLASIATHLASLLLSHVDPELYYNMQSFWSLPELCVMVLGISTDRRAHLN